MTVTLSPFEVMHAAQAAVARMVSAIRDGRPLEEGRRDLGFERHIQGAIGEYAVSCTLDCCWRPAVGRLDTLTGDLGPWQIKATTLPDGSLIVRPHDPPGFAYILAVLTLVPGGLAVELPGWLEGERAKVPEYWRERDPARGIHRAAFFVPQGRLRPLDCLPRP